MIPPGSRGSESGSTSFDSFVDSLAEPPRGRRGGAGALGADGLFPWTPPGLGSFLRDILAAHDAALVCQYDAFAGYCAEAEARGVEHYPLYAWTKAVIADAAKRAKYEKSFSLHVGGAEVYAKETADALEAALAPLVGAGVVTRLAKGTTPTPPTARRCRRSTAPDRDRAGPQLPSAASFSRK